MNLKLLVVLILILLDNPTFAMDKKTPEPPVALKEVITITGLQYCQQFPQHIALLLSNGKQLPFNNCIETFTGKMKIPSQVCGIKAHKKKVVSLMHVSFPYSFQIPNGPKITFKDATTMKLEN
ncbi:MAG TPA: hypothetical protein VFF04_06385 [Candidatus Babeliales bacterium]|nr:hypothetical protein [Candidatus Babeliales bacterium]